MTKKIFREMKGKNNLSDESLTKLWERSKEDIALALMAESLDIERAFQKYKKGYLERKKTEISQ